MEEITYTSSDDGGSVVKVVTVTYPNGDTNVSTHFMTPDDAQSELDAEQAQIDNDTASLATKQSTLANVKTKLGKLQINP